MPPYANEFLVLLSIAAALTAVFSVFVLRAYRLTGRVWLLSFCLGFALLEVSFLFVLFNRFFGKGALYSGTLWVHQVIQTAGFGFIAATYYMKDRDLPVRRLGLFAGVCVAALIVALILYFAMPADMAISLQMWTDEYLYGAGLGLVAYALSKAAKGIAAGPRRTILVPAGFSAFAIGQISWVYWGITDAGNALLLAGSSLPFGLALLTATVVMIWRGR